MMNKNFLRITGVANIVSAVLLLLFWFLFAILLPLNEVPTNYHLLILDPNWLLVNILGVFGFVLALVGILGLFFKQYNELTWYGVVGFLITFVGQVFYNAGMYYETFIWPILAASDPTLVELSTGPIYSNPVFFAMQMVAGTMYAVGFLIFAISAFRSKAFSTRPTSKWAILPLVLGVIMFIPGFFPYVVRTIGIVVYAIGIVWVGVILIRKEPAKIEEKEIEEKEGEG